MYMNSMRYIYKQAFYSLDIKLFPLNFFINVLLERKKQTTQETQLRPLFNLLFSSLFAKSVHSFIFTFLHLLIHSFNHSFSHFRSLSWSLHSFSVLQLYFSYASLLLLMQLRRKTLPFTGVKIQQERRRPLVHTVSPLMRTFTFYRSCTNSLL